MTPAEKNVVRHVTKRVDQMDLIDAIDITAVETGFAPQRIRDLWLSLGINPVQERMIEFLKHDHGPCKLSSLLPRHPLARDLEVGRGDLYAEFAGESFVIFTDGGFTPETEAR